MYNYGSEARKLEYGFEATEVTAKKEDKVRAQREVQIEQFKRNALKTLAIVAALLAIVMAREAQIDKLCGEISRKEDSIENLNAVITQKEMQLSGKMDMTIIEQAAVERLGMEKPNSRQYVPLTVAKHDSGEVLTGESSQNGGFAAIVSKAKILLEYLY